MKTMRILSTIDGEGRLTTEKRCCPCREVVVERKMLGFIGDLWLETGQPFDMNNSK
jgi:hypothetical protein